MNSTAKITKSGGYLCAPEGHSEVLFPMGTIVTGQVAEWALADHAAQRMFDPVAKKKVVTPKETKRKRNAPKKNG